ncbi:3259_t:CDS:2 [Gigaspora margarita]|uniref:3259_t:CDS:1 n=1 Tax=Gigaspora margarita TaxID=4874 RepID=A0ABN7VAM3_GIGMA|nr:3259_t:CDS:2 [Gigaspora margarita]
MSFFVNQIFKIEPLEYNPNFHYPLITAYPIENLVTNPNPPPNRIAICSSCKCNQNRNYPPYLCQILPEINSVPLEKHKYLSPIFLYCSLDRTPGAYLNLSAESLFTNQTVYPPWFENSLTNAINWLKENNPYLHAYSRMIPLNLNTTNPFPSAVHVSDDETAPLFQYVQYLTTDPSNICSKAVLLLHMIDPLDKDPFWNDKIEKYFACPLNPVFNDITYKSYYELYEIKKASSITSQRILYYDQLGNTQILLQKENETAATSQVNINLNTTYIVGYRKTAYQINKAICTMIPVQENKFLISMRIQPGARVIFLNNSQHKDQIANSTMGIINDIDLRSELLYVSFCVEGAIINVSFSKYTDNFFINRIPSNSSIVKEYEQLEDIANKPLPLNRT